MTVDSLMHRGLNNNDWVTLMFVVLEGRTTKEEISAILSVPDHEIGESLDKLLDIVAVRLDEFERVFPCVRP